MSRSVRWAARAVVPLLALASLVVVSAPVHAAATPWRFTATVTATFTVDPSSMGAGVVYCPESYVAVGGGLEYVNFPTDFERVAEYRVGERGWQLILHNYRSDQAITAYITATCALAAHIGSLELVAADFNRVGSMAGGVVYCPEGKVAITGTADWNTFGVNSRRIDFMSPTPDGRGWYVTGYSPVNVALHAEAYCASAADVGTTPVSFTRDYASATQPYVQQGCTSDRRVGSAGVIASAPGADPDPTTYRGFTYYSFPTNSPRTWTSQSQVEAGTRLTFVAWCLPASQPVVAITQTPPQLDASSTATFAISVSDPVGEQITTYCSVDGA